LSLPAADRRLVPAACGVLAVLAAVVVTLAVLRPAGWSLSALARVQQGTAMARVAHAHDPGFHTVPAGAYDGQFYWGIAVDPIATGDVHQAFDAASYRYGHPLLGWLGWLLSAGQARAVPYALLLVGLAAMFAGGFLASVLGRSRGSNGWEGLFVACNPGLLYSAAHFLTEPLSVALLLGGLLAYVRARWVLAAVCFGLLVLSKEQFVLIPIALAGWELLRRRSSIRDVAVFALCLLPAAGWWIYARLQLGAWFTTGDNALAFPLSGWKRALVEAGRQSYSPDGPQSVSAEATLVVVAAVLVLVAAALLVALRLRSPVHAIYVPLVLLALCLAPRATVLLRDALRNLSVLLLLVPFVVASPLLLPLRRSRASD
jgi:hypothetical protein